VSSTLSPRAANHQAAEITKVLLTVNNAPNCSSYTHFREATVTSFRRPTRSASPCRFRRYLWTESWGEGHVKAAELEGQSDGKPYWNGACADLLCGARACITAHDARTRSTSSPPGSILPYCRQNESSSYSTIGSKPPFLSGYQRSTKQACPSSSPIAGPCRFRHCVWGRFRGGGNQYSI